LRARVACRHARAPPRLSVPRRRRRAALPGADGRRVGVALPAPLPRARRRRGRDRVPLGEGIRRENEATISKLRFGADERPIGVQIFGADPAAMADAAAFVTDVFRPEFVDINFGCPVKKVVKRNGGSGCLKDMALVDAIIRAVARATHLPVTVKTRSGWSEETRDPVGIALRMQDAGARRSRCTRARARRCTPGTRAGRRSRPSSTRSTSRSSGTATSRRPTTWCACSA
jgi:hypothetical protein